MQSCIALCMLMSCCGNSNRGDRWAKHEARKGAETRSRNEIENSEYGRLLCDSTTLVVFLGEQHQGGRDGGVDLKGQQTRRGIVVGERGRALNTLHSLIETQRKQVKLVLGLGDAERNSQLAELQQGFQQERPSWR